MEQQKKSWLTRDIVGFSLASFFNDFSHEMTTVILPSFTLLLVGPLQAPYVLGLITGISDAVSSITQLIVGWLSDRIQHHKPLLIIGYALTPLFVGLMGTAHYAWQLITYRTIAWIGRGLREPPRDAWLARIVEPKNYGKAFGLQRAFDTLGALAGPLLAFFLISYVPLKTLFFVAIIPGIFSVLAIIVLTHETEEKKAASSSPQPMMTQFKALPGPFIYFLVTRFIFGLGNFDRTLIILRAQEVLVGQTGSSLLATGWAILLYAIFNVIRAISEYGMGVLSDYSNRKYILAVGGFGLFSITCAALIVATPSLWWWVFIFITAAISTASVKTIEKAYSGDLLPATIRGTGYGLLNMINGVGLFASSSIIGIVWSLGAASAGFAFSGIVSVLAMIVLLARRS